MRFLYGDLTEFPGQENTLEYLERLVHTAVDVLKLDHEIDRNLASIEKDREYLTKALDAIEKLQLNCHKTIEAAVADRTDADLLSVLAQSVADKLFDYIEEGKADLEAQIEQRIKQTSSEIDRIANEIRELLKEYYMASGVPPSRSSLRCTFDDQRYQAQAEILDATGVLCTYSLNTSRSELFQSAKRFGDLVPGRLELRVGKKRARFKKELIVETMRIDDALLTLVEDGEEAGEFQLAKAKGDGKEGLRVRRAKGEEGGLEVYRIDTSGEQHEVPDEVLSASSRKALTAFWKRLAGHLESLYRDRLRISSVTSDGKDVAQQRLVKEIVRRLVGFFAPSVREIDMRSPAMEELCLKIEREDGRREEIYVQKQKLTDRVGELPKPLASIFDPLGLGPRIESDDERPVEEDDEVLIVEEPLTEDAASKETGQD